MKDVISKRSFITFMLLFYCLWVGRIVSLIPWEMRLPIDSRRWFAEGVRLGLWVGLPLSVYFSRVPQFWQFTRVKRPIERVWWVRGMLGTIFYMMVSFAVVRYGFGEHLLIVTQRFPLGVYFGVLATGFAEEFFLRGLVLRILEQWLPFWRANLVMAFVFIALHFPSWLYFYGFNQFQIIQSVLMFVFSVWLGWLAKRSDSILPGTAGHILNNYVFGYLIRFVP